MISLTARSSPPHSHLDFSAHYRCCKSTEDTTAQPLPCCSKYPCNINNWNVLFFRLSLLSVVFALFHLLPIRNAQRATSNECNDCRQGNSYCFPSNVLNKPQAKDFVFAHMWRSNSKATLRKLTGESYCEGLCMNYGNVYLQQLIHS